MTASETSLSPPLLRSRRGLTIVFAALVIIAMGSAYTLYDTLKPAGDDIAPFVPTHAVTHLEAAAQQQGMPTTFDEQMTFIDRNIAFAQKASDAAPTNSGGYTDLAGLYLGRARLSGSFDDYATAGALYDKAFAAGGGRGPNLERAVYNFTIHRLTAMDADLDAVKRYAIPDDLTNASVIGLRGERAFYGGHYSQALSLYRASHKGYVMMSTSFRLAYYWGRMGDPQKARRYVDEAESKVIGPQQLQRAFLELYRGILSLDTGLWDDAEARFRRADAIFPGYWLIEEHLAMTLALKGHPDQAMAIYQAIAARTNMPEAADAVAGLYRATGDFDKSKAWADRADGLWRKRLAQLPEAAYGHAVDHYLAFGAPADALAVAAKNYQVRPYGDAATQLAWAYMASHRPQDALDVVAPQIRAGWGSSEIHVVAAEAHALLGQGPEADAERKAALAINPHSLDRNPGLVWLEQ